MFFRFNSKNARKERRYISTINIKNMPLKIDFNNLNSLKNKFLNICKTYDIPSNDKINKIEIGEDFIELGGDKNYREVLKFLNDNFLSRTIKDNINLIDEKGVSMRMQANSNIYFLGLNDINLNYTLQEIQSINDFLDDLRKVVPKILVDVLLIKIINEKKKFELKEEITTILKNFLNEKEDFNKNRELFKVLANYVNQVNEYLSSYSTINTNVNFKYDNSILNWESLINKINFYLLQFLNEINLPEKTDMYFNKVIFSKNKIDSLELNIVLKKRIKIFKKKRQIQFRNRRRNNRRNNQQQFYFKNSQISITNPNILIQILMLINNNFYLIFKKNATDNTITLEMPNLLLLNQLNIIRLYNLEKSKTKRLVIYNNIKGTTNLQIQSFLKF